MPLTRREFLKGAGLVAGAIGVAGAGYNRLIAYTNQPQDINPGISIWYATSCRECPAGCSMVVRCREGHAVKCEGNPIHPINKGRLCARGQAALHGLYDPYRTTGPAWQERAKKWTPVRWDDALRVLSRSLFDARGVAIISDLQTGSLDALMRTWLNGFNSDRLLIYEPISYESVRATNGGVVPHYDIAGSDFLVAFSSDFLENWVSPVEYAAGFMEMRQVRNGNRGYFAYIGPRVSMTAANADVRITIPPGTEEEVATAIFINSAQINTVADKFNLDSRALQNIRRTFLAAQKPLALPGWNANSARAAELVNKASGTSLINVGRPHAVTNIANNADIEVFISSIENGEVDVLLIYGSNPIFSLPHANRFIEALKNVKTIISLSSYMDETTEYAHWVLPSNTPLESWGDYFPYPDIGNLMQPVMGTLFDTRQTGDILIKLAELAGIDTRSQFGASDYYGYLRKRWGIPVSPGSGPEDSSPEWESLLQKGGLWPGSEQVNRTATPDSGYNIPPITLITAESAGILPVTEVSSTPTSSPVLPEVTQGSKQQEKRFNLWAFPHIYYYDGRGANRRWLQETPEPVTKTVWDSWAEIHPDTARKLGVQTDDVIEISNENAKLQVSVYVWNGVAKDTIAIPIGEGHTHYGKFADGFGVNVYPLLSSANPTVKASRTGNSKWIVRIKGSTDQHSREIVQTVRLNEQFKREKPITMPLSSGYTKRDFYPPHKYSGHRWAMVVDLNKCIGCNACVVACYAENNLGVVGPDGIWRRRDMSWIRIDRYIDWEQQSAPVIFQPMLCQHCDAAPCEPVCPVYAAAHSDEGLNMQIYNRCVGTRYCSNNCPYKVRRFNWTDYTWPEPLNWQLNPDVTVRARGVMEKCTFCVQRIREAEITAKKEGRQLRDGEVVPACVQTCPTDVFTFGNLMDSESRVARMINEDPRAYQVLQGLNTKPAVIYLKRII